MALIVLLTIIVVSLSYYILNKKKNKFSHLPSPGACLPVLGHVLQLFSKECKEDPVKFVWNLYKNNQKHGLMYLRIISLDFVYVGDFDTLKVLLNHAGCQGRVTKLIGDSIREARDIRGTDIPGILWSQGTVWEDQRKFTIRALRDFGFGKKGRKRF